jgi:hypothetical protein
MEPLALLGILMPYIVACALIAIVLSFFKSPWFKGVAGEMRVHITIKTRLDKNKYHVLKNVIVPTVDGTTQIDHVIVSEYGVFVIETKNMKGWIFGGARQKTWTQKIHGHTNSFQNPLHQNRKQVKTLKAHLALSDQQLFSVVVFVGSSTFKTEMPENVIRGGDLIRTIRSKDRQVLLSTDVQMILSKIESVQLTPSREATRAHINHVKDKIEKASGHPCPECDLPVGVREVKRGPNREHTLIGDAQLADCRGAAFFPLDDDGADPEVDTQEAFTDSWQERSWQHDDLNSTFEDRPFQ